jgi:hypothetical protein
MLGSDDISVSDKASTIALIERIDRQVFDARWANLLTSDRNASTGETA